MKEKNETSSTYKKIKRSELFILLQNFSNLRTGQDQVMWSIIGSFWTANSVLIVCIFTSQENIFHQSGITVSIVGFVISLVWNLIQNRALKRIILYEDAIKEIEKKLKLEYKHCSFLTSNTKVYESSINKNSARYIMKLFSKSVIYLWLISFFIFTFLLLKKHMCNF